MLAAVVTGCYAEPGTEGWDEGHLAPGKADEAGALDPRTPFDEVEACSISARPWTEEEAAALLDAAVDRFVQLKRDNDALIRERGVGMFAGVKTGVYRAIVAEDWEEAARLIADKLPQDLSAHEVVREIEGTSCIGRVYDVLEYAYGTIGRADEWAAIERCGRAFESKGLVVQRALIENGWASPALGFITDRNHPPGDEEEVEFHRTFLQALGGGTYFGTPVSTSALLENFLPTPGSDTPRDEGALLALGRSRFLAFATVRGGYHVPLVVPAASVPTDIAPAAGAARRAWLEAHVRGEPFVLESHSLRQPWDPTNIEIRPLTEVLFETFDNNTTYATGTLLFAPHRELSLADLEEAEVSDAATCWSHTLNRPVPDGACVQRPSDLRWFRCEEGRWRDAEGWGDTPCAERHPAD